MGGVGYLGSVPDDIEQLAADIANLPEPDYAEAGRSGLYDDAAVYRFCLQAQADAEATDTLINASLPVRMRVMQEGTIDPAAVRRSSSLLVIRILTAARTLARAAAIREERRQRQAHDPPSYPARRSWDGWDGWDGWDDSWGGDGGRWSGGGCGAVAW